MNKRYLSLWFPYLLTDWWVKKNPGNTCKPIVFSIKEHNRLIVYDLNKTAADKGAYKQMTVADAKATINDLVVIEHNPEKPMQLLNAMGKWCIRYSPTVAVDMPNGLIIDMTGCAHLWGGETRYLQHIINEFKNLGYEVKGGIADTAGMAWAASHYSSHPIIETGSTRRALLNLPPDSLRLDDETLLRIKKFGIHTVAVLMRIQRTALRRRFGYQLLHRLDQILGAAEESIFPLEHHLPYIEHLPCLELIKTRTAIEIALKTLLDKMCKRLEQEGRGLRKATLTSYRIDNKVLTTEVNTATPGNNASHLFRLFEMKINEIEPALGIELFTLQASHIETVNNAQESLWSLNQSSLEKKEISHLVDRINIKTGKQTIYRYLPVENYFPERSATRATTLKSIAGTAWNSDRPRPTLLLPFPERIQITAPIPDYPPMLFKHKNELHKIVKADGPERIESSWWIEEGDFRDYYIVEDEKGKRYWVYRSGAYSDHKAPQWFLHGYFA